MKAKRVKKLDAAAPLDLCAARILRVRIAELRSFASRALEPEAAEAQHDMRIAAKRLRYVLEATGFCFGEVAERGQDAAKLLQEVLGELHDCDELEPRIAAHAARLRADDARHVRELAGDAADLDPALASQAPSRTAYRGLETLAVHVQARRMLLHERFSSLWSELEGERVLSGLDELAAERIERA